MTILEELIDKMCEAKDQRTVSIPMGMAVDIVFMISRLEQIMAITKEVKEHKYTELKKPNDVKGGDRK